MPEHTIAENLSRLITAKTDIANAITTMGGGVVGENDGFEEFPADILGIPNRYTSSDEGKVVYNGGLVAQTTATRTTNGTVDTTRIKSLTVNVPVGETPINGTVTGIGINSTQTNSYAIQKGKWVLIYARLVEQDYKVGQKLFTVTGLNLPSTTKKAWLTSTYPMALSYVITTTSIQVSVSANFSISTAYRYIFILME